jgi:VCBS repeat-containing protein
VVINGDNTITYTPSLNYTGADSFTYTVTSGGVSETATVSVNVTAVNDAPTVEGVIADQTLAEDFASYTIDLNAAFADVETADGDLVYGVSGNTHINVSIASGIATITPTADWNGSETLTFSATDAGGLSVSQVVGFAVTAVADIADDAAVAVVEDTATIITVLGNDSFEGTPVVTATSSPANGAVVINGDNTITYTPSLNYTGADSFTYTVTSGGVSETATVSVNVTPVNDAPTIGGVDVGAVAEDTDPDLDTLLEASGALTISDPDAGESSFVAGTVTGSQGYLIIDAAGNWDYVADNTQAAIQQLDVGESINDVLTVTTADGTTHDITVTINGAEDAPIIGGITSALVTEDGTLTATGSLTITDADASDNPVGFPDEASTPGDNGYGEFQLIAGNWSYALNNAHAAVQALAAGTSLTDTHTFTASDGSTQVVSIVIAGAAEAVPPPVDAPPVPEPEPIERVAPPPETEDPVEPPAEADPAPESAPLAAATDPSIAEPESEDPPASALSSRFPEPLEPDEIFLEILNDSRPNDVPTVKQTAVVAKPTAETAQTFLQELKSFWKEDSTTTSIEMSEVHFSKEFWNGLDKMAQDLDESIETEDKKHQLSAEAAAGVGISLTAGFVSWAMRAGSMAASLLAAMPTWRHFDPMPVLAADDKKKQNPVSTNDVDEETREMEKNERIERLFSEEQ